MNNKQGGGGNFDINPNKFDYFYGKVKAPDSNLELTNLKKYKQLNHKPKSQPLWVY